MKNAKRILALMLVVAMVFAFGTTAFAANDGSITIRNATVGQDYEAYKVFDLTYTGENASYSYTKTGDSDGLYTALTGDDSPFTLSATSDPAKFSVEVKAGKTAADIAEWLTDNKDLLGTATAATPTGGATSSVVEFTGLPYGYYYITSSLGSIVTIDSTLKDVKVVDKNEVPGWDNEVPPDDPNYDPNNPNPGKVIIEEDADGNEVKVLENVATIGETVDFSIAVNATAWVKDGAAKNPDSSEETGNLATYYYIQDTLEPGFDPATDIEVYVTSPDYNNGVKTKLTAGTDYTLIQNGNFFQVTVPFGEKYGANAIIDVRYSATVNDDAEFVADSNTNTATFGYDTKDVDPDNPENPDNPDDPGFDPKDPTDPNFPDDPYEPITPDDPDYPEPGDPNYPEDPTQPVPDPNTPEDDEAETETYVLALGLVKTDDAGEILTGATFTLEVKEGTGDSATWTPVATAAGTNGVYVVDPVAANNTVTEFAVGDNGQILIEGLPEGTYRLTETNPPEGYNLLSAKPELTLAKDGDYTDTLTVGSKTYTFAENANTIQVVNKTGTEMPSTGGMGTTLFYVIGAILVCGAGVLLVTRRRMSKAK